MANRSEQRICRLNSKAIRGAGREIHYSSKVTKIITKNDKAVGIKLADGSEAYADIIISNADGRKTLNELQSLSIIMCMIP